MFEDTRGLLGLGLGTSRRIKRGEKRGFLFVDTERGGMELEFLLLVLER